jgi:dolichol-phosphate mannosyltransferase
VAENPPPARRRSVRVAAGRVRGGVRRPHVWLQLGRFAVVGASGYVVNLSTFAIFDRWVDLHYRAAATAAFLVAVTNNFVWNRRWTFPVGPGSAASQAGRFFTVSVLAFALNVVVLTALVELADVDTLLAQATAIIVATPVSFIGNKLWTFDR